jgi:anti-sigma B factor antagonist
MGEVLNPVLRIDHKRSADQHRIRLVGELDVSNVDQARRALSTAIEGEDAAVIVDMSELEFIDSTGISMLLDAQAASRLDSNRLGFRDMHPQVARTLELTGADQQLRFVD